MRADIGGGGLAIAHLSHRKARGHLLTGSGRGMIVAVMVAIALLVGLGVTAGHAVSNPTALTPYALIGR
jgi:hypothetical protein